MNLKSSDLVRAIVHTEPTACSCGRCVAMCERCPCIGTPQDMLRLIEAGHRDKLAPTLWAAQGFENAVEMIAIDAQGMNDPGVLSPCPFLRDGLCGLHDSGNKPTEGVLASCQHTQEEAARILAAVVASWLLPRNARLIAHLFALYEPPQGEGVILL